MERLVRLYINTGTDTFTGATGYLATATSVTTLALADLDGNSLVADVGQDCARFGSTLVISARNGNGTFQDARTLRTASCVASIASGDFDGDGRIDLVVTGAGADSPAGEVSPVGVFGVALDGVAPRGSTNIVQRFSTVVGVTEEAGVGAVVPEPCG